MINWFYKIRRKLINQVQRLKGCVLKEDVKTLWGVPIEALPVLVNGKERLKMESLLSTPLKEQEKFQELFQILDEKGLYEEKGQILNLVDYIDNMDKQFGKVLKELKTVKHQVKKLEERRLKQRLLRTIGTLEGKLCAARDELIEVKNQLVDGVHRTIDDFKSRGVLAVYKTIDFLGIKRGLLGVKKQLHQSLETADRGIASLGNIGDEMYGVRTHLGNIKRELAGKEPLTVGSREVEKGAVFQVQKMLYGTMGVLDTMEKHTDRTIRRLDSLGERAQGIQKPSVRESLKAIQVERNANVRKPVHQRARAAAR